MRDKRVLVTGGAGFLGSHFTRLAVGSGVSRIVNVDALTYAGDRRRLSDVEGNSAYSFVMGDISDRHNITTIFNEFKPEIVVHYAADTHVTRSESDPERFLRTNLEGTRVLLESSADVGVEKFVHISTDEVYGSILEGSFTETDKMPGDSQASPGYAKTKAQADDLALGFAERLPVVVARPTNAFGEWQFPEKAFPRWITRGLRGEPLLVWGDGLYVRQWLFAGDFARAIALLVEKGEPGTAYNVGPTHEPEITNLDLAKWLASRLGLGDSSIQLTDYDRPDHDRRYSVDATRIKALGWEPGGVYEQFEQTVTWYESNRGWWESHVDEAESIYTDSPAR